MLIIWRIILINSDRYLTIMILIIILKQFTTWMKNWNAAGAYIEHQELLPGKGNRKSVLWSKAANHSYWLWECNWTMYPATYYLCSKASESHVDKKWVPLYFEWEWLGWSWSLFLLQSKAFSCPRCAISSTDAIAGWPQYSLWSDISEICEG